VIAGLLQVVKKQYPFYMQDADDRIEIAKLNFKLGSDNLKSASLTPVAPVDDFRFETERGLAEGGGSEMAYD